MVSHGVDEIACGGDGQHDRTGIVGPACDPSFFIVLDADISGQPEGRQPVQQAIFIKGHYLRRMPGGGQLPAVIGVGEFPAADDRYQCHRSMPVSQQAVLQRRTDSER
jgi:hypothetical protein